jgi:hypothetical protein
LFKGPQVKEFTFFSESKQDILENYQEYFVIVNPRASSLDKTIIDGEVCDTRGIKYAVNSYFQTFYPIQLDPENGKPEYLLVSRHSPFITGNFVSSNSKYIELFGIENERIYALASWKEVIDDIRKWMGLESK